MNVNRYPPSRQWLHWLTVLLLCAAAGLGLYMTGLKLSPTKLALYSYHKWIGVVVFAVALARLWLALRQPVPEHPAHWAWQAAAARVTHRALYLLLIAIPLSGWLMSSAKGFQTVFLSVLPIPDLLAKDPALGDQLAIVHQSLNWLLLILVGGHVGAALGHHFVLRDGILLRMMPMRAGRKP
jgi:cytochrome b561